jgi:hypothetical protein
MPKPKKESKKKNQVRRRSSKAIPGKAGGRKPVGVRKKRVEHVKPHRTPAKSKKREKKNEKERSKRRTSSSRKNNTQHAKKTKNEPSRRIQRIVPVSRKSNSRTSRVKKNEKRKKPAKQKRTQANRQTGASKKRKSRKTKSAKPTTVKRRARAGTRTASSKKKKKAKKPNKPVSKRLRKPKKDNQRNKIVPVSKKSNRTYFVTVKLASGKHERKRPLNIIVWAKDGLENQEVIELLWAMIKRRNDKRLIFALDMEVRELIVYQGPLTDRLQGYRQN